MFDKTIDLIKYIESLPRFHQDYDKSLTKMKSYLNLISFKQTFKVIHIAGTNGKGSTAKMLEAILCQHQKTVGCFTSPYMISFNERFRINQENISDSELLSIGNYLIDLLKDEDVIFFEFITLLCLIYFTYHHIDIAIMECGIGGILDSTNVLDDDIDIITSISYDHQQVLGHTLEEILNNKLGIVKKNNPLLININEDLKEVVKRYYSENKYDYNQVLFLNKPFDIMSNIDTNTSFTYNNIKYSTNLKGYHQAGNAVMAIEAAKLILNEEYDEGLTKTALLNVEHYGRFEVISNQPLIILDGAHNIEGATTIIDYLKQYKENYHIRAFISIKYDKDYVDIIKLYSSFFDDIYLTTMDNIKTVDLKALYEASKSINLNTYQFKLSEIENYIDNDSLNIIIGSLYFVSEVRKILTIK